jgi:hypothetical protein
MALDVRKFGPKSDKIGVYSAAFLYQVPSKRDFLPALEYLTK